LLHPQEDIIIDDSDDSTTGKEIEADRFAANLLIPAEFQHELRSLRDNRSVIAFARRVGISRGIVVGQMQYQKIMGFDRFNNLKIYYQWDNSDHIEKKLT
jgi:Zn-dependent peptidase ImmA (M78 family)